MQSKARTVDLYIAELPEERRGVVKRLRSLVQKSAPRATESMRYGMPTYELGELLCAFAAQKGHYSLYVMDTKLVDAFRPQLGKLSVGKGCIRFKKVEEVPLDVVGALLGKAAARRAGGVTEVPCDGGDA
jgi:uncharacterized protein YdhG (YjbR/CyaY superfamily)